MREADAPHSRDSIIASSAMDTTGLDRLSTMSRFTWDRSRESASIRLRGISPTRFRLVKPHTSATTVARMIASREPGTFSLSLRGHSSMKATTRPPMSTACQSGWKPRRV